MSNLELRDITVGRAIPLKENDVDTDRIIPARFMKCVTFEGLGEYAFHDVRYDESGKEKNHPFNSDTYKGGSILLTGRNFGCGSSREHAPQALMRFGIRAVVGVSFAEIFIGNCAVMGIPCVSVTEETLDELISIVTAFPQTELTVDVDRKTVTAGEKSFPAEIKETFRKAFIEGRWDSTAELLFAKDAIRARYEKLPYTAGFQGRR